MEELIESRFTPSRDWCKHPEYWHSPDSEATEIEVSEFIGSLVRLIQPEYVVETGTYHGHTTYQIGAALEDNGHGRLVSVDNDRAALAEAFKNIAEMEGFRENPLPVTILDANSMEFIPDQDIDFAFFDSWQEGRIEEYTRFYSMGRLKPGTIVAFHDTAPHHQVRKTILPLEGIGEGELSIIDFHTPRGLIVGQVR